MTVQIGIVRQTEDPSGDFRVLVHIPLVWGEEPVWARLATPLVSGGSGSSFFPEIGDEVLVAFINDDPNAPVVIGSLRGHVPAGGQE